MATDGVPLAVGAFFNSFAELKAAIDARSNALNEKLVIGRSSRIVTATNAKIKGQSKYKEGLVYTSITFRCVHEGDFHSKGHIKDSRSMKIGCPVQVKVIADKVRNKLRIVHADLQHNHVLPQKKDGVYFQDRKLSKEEEEDVENLINLGVSVRRIVDHILSSYNKPVKAKDIHNLKKKLENRQAALKAKGKAKTRGQDGADPSSLKNGTRREILSFLEKSRKKSCGKITEVKIEQEDPQSDDADCSEDDANSRTYQDQISEDESSLFSDGTFQNKEPKDKLLKSEVSQKEVSENELFSKDEVSETEASLEADSQTHSDISQLEASNIEVSHNEAAQSFSTTTMQAIINLSSMKPNLSLQTSLRTRSKQPPKCKRAESDSTEEMCSTSSTSASSPVPCVVSTSAEIRIEKNDSDQKTQEERMRAANEHFGSYIAESLSSMSPQAYDWCIMQINNAIYKARSGMWCQ